MTRFFEYYNLLKIDEDKARFYIAQIALTIAYLHSMGRKYNNLTLDDFYLDDKGYLRLTKNEIFMLDLNNAFIYESKNDYLAPEIISNECSN